MQSVRGVLRQRSITGSQTARAARMQSVRGVLRQSPLRDGSKAIIEDAIRTGCAEAKYIANEGLSITEDAIRAGCAEAKLSV